MRYEFVESFAESASEALGQALGEPVKKGSLVLKESPMPSRGVATIIALTGEVEGRVIFDMTASTARGIAGSMNGKKFDDLGALVYDTICELSNIMIGRAVTSLNDQNFIFEVNPPTTISGKDLSISDYQLETLVIPLTTQYGDVDLNVALRAR